MFPAASPRRRLPCRVTRPSTSARGPAHSAADATCRACGPHCQRPGAGHGQARPAQRHRPGAAPAAALRGRDPADAARRAARRRGGAGRGASSATAASRPGRAASWSCGCATTASELLLRFLHFYPSQQKSLAPGARVRVRGEVRGGFFGREMVHPAFKAVGEDAPLPTALTPVYPTSAQLPQAYLRKAIVSALARAPLQELLPPDALPPGLPSLREALQFLHHPPPDASLATLERPQPPGLAAPEVRGAAGAAAVAGRRRSASARSCARRRCARAPRPACSEQLLAALPFALTAAQQRVGAEIARRPGARAADAPPAAGRRRLGQDRGRGAGRGAGHRRRLAMRADGADRDPGRAALPQAGALAGAAGRRRGLAHRQPQGQGAHADGRRGGQRRGRRWWSARTR